MPGSDAQISISVPSYKVDLITEDIECALQSGWMDLHTAHRLTGRLTWFSQLTPYLKSYLSGLFGAISYCERHNWRKFQIGKSLRADLALRKTQLITMSMVVLPEPSNAPYVIATDACLNGIGGWLRQPHTDTVLYFACLVNDIPFHFRESILTSPGKTCPDDVCRLELLALCLGVCLAILVRSNRNDHFILLSDNSAASRALSRCYSSRFRMSILLRELALVLASQAFPLSYRSVYVKGECNTFADALSRGWVPSRGPKTQRVDIDQLFSVLHPST